MPKQITRSNFLWYIEMVRLKLNIAVYDGFKTVFMRLFLKKNINPRLFDHQLCKYVLESLATQFFSNNTAGGINQEVRRNTSAAKIIILTYQFPVPYFVIA